MKIERRQHPRALVHWPVVVEANQGSIEGETKDISVDGVFILCSEEPENGETFPIIIMPSEKRFISVVGEKVWSGTFDFHQMTLYGMGVRFIHISPDDRQYLAAFVEKERNE